MNTASATAPAAEELRQLARQLGGHRGFADVVQSLEAGHGGTLGGVWGSSCALVAAALAPNCSGPLIVVLPHASDVDHLSDDLSLFSLLPVARFPAWESDAGEQVVHDEIFAQRLRVLKTLSERSALAAVDTLSQGERAGPDSALAEPVAHDESASHAIEESLPAGPIVVTSIQSLLQPVPGRDAVADATRTLSLGSQLDEQELASWLVARGGHPTSAVELPGEFSIRGGIVDVFPPDAEHPLRIELFGDEVDSIRQFDVATQRSLATLRSVRLTMLEPRTTDRAHFTAYVPEGAWFLLVEPHDLTEEGKFYLERLDHPEQFHSVRTTLAEITKYPSVTASAVPSGSLETTCHLEFESVERFSGEVGRVREELEASAHGQDVYLVCENEAEIERLEHVFAKSSLLTGGEEDGRPLAADVEAGLEGAASRAAPLRPGRLHFVEGHLHQGFRIVPWQVVLISAAELFHRQELVRTRRRQQGRAIESFLDLSQGDLVVHVAHGIGRYRGLTLLEKEGRREEHLELEYHGGTKIYVPSSKIDLVQKYVGGVKGKPTLARIGGKAWVRQKQAAQRAVTDLAADMIEMAARRDARPGIIFPRDTEWQREFDASFPYNETPDQLAAVSEIKGDMQEARPMDRLLCGDVGFGKTELAIRAAFKAVDAGYQVAVLVPTTILAEQHRRTFAARMAEFPFHIAALSRFCTQREQREIVQKAAEGSLDILIGTHRLASPDVQFGNLGLLIIDEEQRFGVAVKEHLKALRTTVDVLTMTATPIPRTLHMSLLGVRAISNLETPPADRLAVETRVTRFNDELVRHAILRELNRNGQIFFVHNRINDIGNVATRLSSIVPEARIEIGHGQMPERELEEVMLRFVRGEFDVLLSTTIVESGLDIPTANTIFIDDADRYGLADLHQLRGRVGRYKHRAYCYLLVDEDRHLSPQAARRLRAIEEFSQMGAGFALAMRDLELRGAGNIIGTQQSGHIASVGYELYCALLEKAVRHLKNLPPRDSVDVNLDLPGEAFLDRAYVPDMRSKVDLYRRLTRFSEERQVDDFAAELADRFGPLPPPTEHLIDRARLRIWAHQRGIHDIHLEDRYVVLGYTSRQRLEGLLARSARQLRVADGSSAYLPLPPGVTTSEQIFATIKSLLRPA